VCGETVARLDGDSWPTYSHADLGESNKSFIGPCATDGDELWAVTLTPVVHWDGRRWTSYPEAALHGPPSIVASGGRAWALDADGYLSVFENGLWTVHKTELPEGPDDDHSPELSLSANGNLWMVLNGVWRWGEDHWAAVKPDGHDLKDMMLLGSTQNSLWLWDPDGLRGLDSDKTLVTYTLDDIGLSDSEWLTDVTSVRRPTWFGSSTGVVAFNGRAWQRIPPAAGVQGTHDVQVGPDGALWAVGMTSNPHYGASVLLMTLLPLGLLLALIAGPVWLYHRYKRYRLSDYQRLRQAVENGIGETPEELHRKEQELARQASWRGAFAVLVVIFGALVAYDLVRLRWPAAPSWTYLAIALALHLGIAFWQSAVRRIPKPNDPIEPARPFQYDWRRTWQAAPGSLLVFLLLNLHELPAVVSGHLHWILYGFLVLLWYRAGAERILVTRLRRGDFEGALRVVPIMWLPRPEGPTALRYRGVVLLAAGRYAEAEDCLRRAIAGIRSASEHAQALETLGDVLLEQGRYDEAQRSYAAAVNVVPRFRRPYRGMAELLLRQKKPELALEYIERLTTSVKSAGAFRIDGKVSDDYWSLKAWALAELGRGAEVNAAVENAIRSTNSKSRIDMASMCRRTGLALEAIGDRRRADEFFERACKASPRGRWGLLAKTAMAHQKVWA
jgi:tetratricopeptide (TPR) repeat protein